MEVVGEINVKKFAEINLKRNERIDYSIRKTFYQNQNKENALYMQKYMKNKFPFLGIKTPKRKELMKVFYQETGILKKPIDREFVLALWNKDEREFQYAALQYIERSLKKFDRADLPLMEQLITTKSWWDTVDLLASKAVGKIAKDHPSVIEESIEGWAYGNNLWLKRTAILFQLKYKENTDKDLLYRFIKQNAECKNSLAALSVREGGKYI
jgi:3-methyladenine DNA glycosylase AlkD